MHARKTVIKGSPENAAKAKEVIESKVIPTAKQLPGFQGGYWLLDRETGDGVTFTFFDTRESLQSSAEAATRLRNEATGEIGASVGSVEEFEVALDTGQKVHRDATRARVIHFEGSAADLDQGLNNIRERVIPGARQLPGFLGGFWLVDRSSGKGVGVTLFDSAENMAAGREQANQIRSQSAQSFQARLGEFKEYEVVAKAETPAAVGSS